MMRKLRAINSMKNGSQPSAQDDTKDHVQAAFHEQPLFDFSLFEEGDKHGEYKKG